MINKLLVLILTKVFKVDPRMMNPLSWRLANSMEHISKFLGFCPLIYTSWQARAQYGFENVVFLGLGRIYLVPNKLNKEYKPNADKLDDYQNQIVINTYGVDMIHYTLFRNYITNNPNILLGRIPTKLLTIFIKRVSKQQIKQLKKLEDEKNEVSDSLSDAIRDDLASNTRLPEEVFASNPKSKPEEN